MDYILKPQVTELVAMLDRPQLMKWANKLGLEGTPLDQYRKKSLDDGASLHQQIERRFKAGVPFEDSSTDAAFLKFMEGKQPLSVEGSVETDWFTGRYDIELAINDETWICDFKSGSKVYFEMALQLCAYRMAKPGVRLAIVEIPSFTIHELITPKPQPFETIIKCLSRIWSMKSAAIFTTT